jgi:hypothetical protein
MLKQHLNNLSTDNKKTIEMMKHYLFIQNLNYSRPTKIFKAYCLFWQPISKAFTSNMKEKTRRDFRHDGLKERAQITTLHYA